MIGREALRAYVGGLGPLLGHMLAVLGRSWALCWLSWSLCWRSWAALRAYVGGLESRSGLKLAVLGSEWSVLEAIRAKSGLNPGERNRSGKRIMQESGPNASGKGPKEVLPRERPERPECPEARYAFFL